MVPKAKFLIEARNNTGPGIGAALRDINKFGMKASGVLRTAFAGVSIAGLSTAVGRTLEFGDKLNTAAIKAGVTGEAISELAYAAKLANVDLDGLSSSL